MISLIPPTEKRNTYAGTFGAKKYVKLILIVGRMVERRTRNTVESPSRGLCVLLVCTEALTGVAVLHFGNAVA